MNIRALAKNKLVSETLIYGITNAVYSGLPLLLLPFLVATLGPEDYGYVDLFRSISMFLVPILGLSTVQSITRFYYDFDEKRFKIFVTSIQLFQLLTSIIATIIVCCLSPFLSDTYQILLLLSIAYFLFNQFTEGLLAIYRVNNKAKSYLFIRVANILLELGILFILFKVLQPLDWKFRVLPTVISSFLVAILTIVQFVKLGYMFKFSSELLKLGIMYSAPLVLHMLSGYVLNIGDRFFIKYYLSEKDLGNYAVAYQIGMAINFFYTSFNLAWTPTYFKWMQENKTNQIKKVRKLIYLIVPLLGILTLLVWFSFSDLFIKHSEYKISNQIIIVVLIANVILSLYKFESNFYLYTKDTKKLSIFTFISAIISVVLNFALIPRIGIIGAAIATLISFIVVYFLVLFSKKNDKIHQEPAF
ncbi:oligosaccharide flippase family protein [Sphingobacterium sp. ML3W]|uniref:lipopolysaccharide biosynthesis protein n=1 Tax=Sphingobacterium sp. ML3W TaxID=1538644 RepID=UPI00249BE5DE|nr:oligosaccharide flippase family protein [Sphingobacterium sp. ML3W]WFA78191.1 oligosaccharide flippase family protein [Sphingobacterium sp. ML3W]